MPNDMMSSAVIPAGVEMKLGPCCEMYHLFPFSFMFYFSATSINYTWHTNISGSIEEIVLSFRNFQFGFPGFLVKVFQTSVSSIM